MNNQQESSLFVFGIIIGVVALITFFIALASLGYNKVCVISLLVLFFLNIVMFFINREISSLEK